MGVINLTIEIWKLKRAIKEIVSGGVTAIKQNGVILPPDTAGVVDINTPVLSVSVNNTPVQPDTNYNINIDIPTINDIGLSLEDIDTDILLCQSFEV